MPKQELKVFRIDPVVGKCYEHIEATRSVALGNGKRNYFSSNKPTYVGEFVRLDRDGYGQGGTATGVFNNNGTEVEVHYTFDTCFNEVPCKSNGGSKSRKTRNLNKKTRKTRSRSRK